jgi:hypothetical protein
MCPGSGLGLRTPLGGLAVVAEGRSVKRRGVMGDRIRLIIEFGLGRRDWSICVMLRGVMDSLGMGRAGVLRSTRPDRSCVSGEAITDRSFLCPRGQ